jgi:anti-sigma factor RsiW
VINLFVAQHLGTKHRRPNAKIIQGYNCRHWTQDGLDLWAVSDIVGDELDEFVQKISGSLRQPSSAT